MNIIESSILFVVLMLLASLHTVGEIIYKKGGMQSLGVEKQSSNSEFLLRFITSPIVVLSLLISVLVKVLYGVLLASNPLHVAGGIYLAGVAIFSAIGGKIVFDEKISKRQVGGFVLISVGIIGLV